MHYAILERQNLVPQIPVAFDPALLVPGLWAIDLETKGTDAADPDSLIVGIGLANSEHCFYIDMTTLNWPHKVTLSEFIRGSQFVPFNALFDGTFVQRLTGHWPNIVGDAYALFKQLSSEGWIGQQWNLEVAQLAILGWPTSNKEVLNAALKERGFTKADMWRLPAEILGPYCAQDACAAWQLWEYLNHVCRTKLSQDVSD